MLRLVNLSRPDDDSGPIPDDARTRIGLAERLHLGDTRDATVGLLHCPA